MTDKYLNLARKLKKQNKTKQNKKNRLNMKATVIPIVIGALETVPKGLEKWGWKS